MLKGQNHPLNQTDNNISLMSQKNSNAALEQTTWTQCCRRGLSWDTGLWETIRGRLNKPAKSLHTTANSHRPQAICQITYWSPVYQAKSNGTTSHLGPLQAQLAQSYIWSFQCIYLNPIRDATARVTFTSEQYCKGKMRGNKLKMKGQMKFDLFDNIFGISAEKST